MIYSKNCFASCQVKVLKGSAGPFTSPTPVPSRPVQKIQDQQQTAALAPALPSVTIPLSTNVNENENTNETEGLYSFIILICL